MKSVKAIHWDSAIKELIESYMENVVVLIIKYCGQFSSSLYPFCTLEISPD